jgi:hypothetical protein
VFPTASRIADLGIFILFCMLPFLKDMHNSGQAPRTSRIFRLTEVCEGTRHRYSTEDIITNHAVWWMVSFLRVSAVPKTFSELLTGLLIQVPGSIVTQGEVKCHTLLSNPLFLAAVGEERDLLPLSSHLSEARQSEK